MLFGACLVHAQNVSSLNKAVSEIEAEEDMGHATLSVCVYNMDKQSVVYSHEAHRSVVPASLTKLFTTAAGFDRLGGDFRFRTYLKYAGEVDKSGTLHGDLYIIGGGDPLLGSYRYKQTVPDSLFGVWQRAISAAGIKAVDGRVYYDASVFDKKQLHDSWQWGDVGNYYAGGVCGLNFHENTVFLHFRPGARVGYPATVARTEPKGASVHVINEVLTGAARTGDKVVVYGDPSSTIRTCRGTVPVDSKSMSIRSSMPKPAAVCADMFTAYLRSHKISVSGAATEVIHRPANMVDLMEYTSPTYYVIAQYTNMTSNNTYAEAIHKYLGYQQHGRGSHEMGAKVVSDYLKSMKLDMGGVRLEDGSGLSTRNRVTSDFVCRFLSAVSHKKYFGEYKKTLGQAGENGTVRNMLAGLPSGAHVYMKSGSMDGVRAFAGYAETAKGGRYCFAVVCNDYECSGSLMRSRLEKIIMRIATLE